MSRVKCEHYVPRLHLKRFCAEGEQIYVYDKLQKKSFLTHIENIACEKYFYDVPRLDSLVGIDQFVEKFHQRIEDRASAAIAGILDSADVRIHPEQRHDLALFLTLQFLRTKERREQIVQIYEKTATMEFKEYVRSNAPHLLDSDLNLELSGGHEAIHAATMLDVNYVTELADIMKTHIWILVVNKTQHGFYTSDNPVSNYGHLRDSLGPLSGIASPGVEISFPLTPKCLLCLFERHIFKSYSKLDGGISDADDANVDHFNSLRVQDSTRYVFAREQDFQLVENICSKYPHLANPKRNQF